jgi:flagellar biosynthesis protein
MYDRKQLAKIGYLSSGLKRAAALGYDANIDSAPIVIATGKGAIAEQIIAIARANHIPIREDAVLVEALSRLEINQTIPAELYEIVAEVLAFVYRLRADLGD